MLGCCSHIRAQLRLPPRGTRITTRPCRLRIGRLVSYSGADRTSLALASDAGTTRALGFYYALQRFLELRGRWQVQIEWANALLALGEALGPKDRMQLLIHLGNTYLYVGDLQRALNCYAEAEPLAQQEGDLVRAALILNNRGQVLDALGEKQRALGQYRLAFELQSQLGDVAGQAKSLGNLGLATMRWEIRSKH